MYARVRLLSSLLLLLLFPVLSGCFLSNDDKQSFQVIEYIDEPFTAADVYHTWSVEVDGENVILQEFVNPDIADQDVVQQHVYYLKLRHKEGRLPEILDVWHGPQGGGLSQRTKTAGIAIQSWDINGVISGYIETVSVIDMRHNARFWVDLGATEE